MVRLDQRILNHRQDRRALFSDAAKLGAGIAGASVLGVSAPHLASAQDSTEISMMGWGSPLEQENVEKGLEAFEAETPEVSVEWIHVPDDYETKLKTAIAGDTAPDVFWATNMSDYVALGAVMDITAQVTGDPVIGAADYFLQPQEDDRAKINGKWFGIGSCWVAPHLYYNADILAEAGITPPSSDPAQAWTWEQFVDIGKQLTIDSNGKHPGEEGFDVENVSQWGLSWPTDAIQRNAAIYSNLGYAYSTDYTCGYGDPEAIEALQAVADLTLVHQVAPVPAAFEQMGMDAWTALATGNVAIICDGSWALQDIAKLEFNFGCGVLPKLKEVATVMLAHCHVISATTEHPDESWKLLAYLSSDAYQLGLCQAGLWLPSHTSLLSAEGQVQWLTEGVHPEGYGQIASDYVLNYGHAMFYPVGFSETDKLLTAALDKVWVGDATAQEALVDSGVIDEVNAVLTEKKALIAAV
ncbi:sugar ABC transporter substrate-binding protein [soil metagenome]